MRGLKLKKGYSKKSISLKFMQEKPFNLKVNSEIGSLVRLIVHSPDSGLGKVVPTKAQDWLFEDIIHLETMRRKEYDFYIKILLFFLDYPKIYGQTSIIDNPKNNRVFYKPEKPEFHSSEYVIEFQLLLTQILDLKITKGNLIAAVCAVEKCSNLIHEELLELSPIHLSKTLISGTFPDGRMIFPPIPNLIFTRDIGVVIGDHLLLSRPATTARSREALLGKYIFFNHPLFSNFKNKILELPDNIHFFLLPEGENDLKKTTLEGGDVMMIGPSHLLIGCSERTSQFAVDQVIKLVFKKNLVNKVSVVKIPNKRAYMHIDTIFTQVKRDVWVMLGSLGRSGDSVNSESLLKGLDILPTNEKLKILQFHKGLENSPIQFAYLEDLLEDISIHDFKQKGPIKIVYSGGNEFPYDAREQWTDSCNLLCLKEGVVIGYDRNDKTAAMFMNINFKIRNAEELLAEFESGKIQPDEIENTLILLPSAELSRARGGSHCMSMPLERKILS